MGSRGTTNTIKNIKSYVGKTLNNLPNDTDEIAKLFDVDFTQKQKETIGSLIRSMKEYDRSRDNDSTSYNLTDIDVTTMNNTKDIIVSIATEPSVGNDWLKIADSKTRFFMLGSKGGMYKYGNNSRKVPLKFSDVAMGEHFMNR